MVGESIFDSATTQFLINNKENPVDFEDFCAEYKVLCGVENETKLSQFFSDWIYSCNALKKMM